MHNVEKWPNILEKSCGVNTARFLKYVWQFYNIMHERVNEMSKFCRSRCFINFQMFSLKNVDDDNDMMRRMNYFSK